MKTEQEEQKEFNRLLELTFLRKERQLYKHVLRQEEKSIQEELNPKPKIKFQKASSGRHDIEYRKKQLQPDPYLEFEHATTIIAQREQKRNQFIKKIIIAIILISILLLFFAKFYL
jgi:hypothetical protein